MSVSLLTPRSLTSWRSCTQNDQLGGPQGRRRRHELTDGSSVTCEETRVAAPDRRGGGGGLLGHLVILFSLEDVQLAVGGGRSARCVSRSCLTSGCAFSFLLVPLTRRSECRQSVGRASAELRAIKTARTPRVKSAAEVFHRDDPRRQEHSAVA